MKIKRPWIEASFDELCEICGSDHACKFMRQGIWICCRVKEAPPGWEKRKESGEWVTFVRIGTRKTQAHTSDDPEILDFVKQVREDTRRQGLVTWAGAFGTSPAILEDFGCCVERKTENLVIPEYDADWNLIGLVRRKQDGRKFAKGRRGLNLPVVKPDSAKVVVISEGFSDLAAAALATGSWLRDALFIGRSSKNGNIGDVMKIAKELKVEEAIILLDADDTEEKHGGHKLGRQLSGEGINVKLVRPPAKDFREYWQRRGTTERGVRKLIDDTPYLKPVRRVDPRAPLDTAREFLKLRPNMRCHRDRVLDWIGTHYSEVEEGQLRSALYQFGHEAVDDHGAPFRPTPRWVDDTIDAIRALTHISADFSPPIWLSETGAVPAVGILALENGLLHVATGKLLRHTAEFFNVYALPFAYKADAPRPAQWIAFLNDVFDGDAEQIALFQEYVGLSLMPDTSLQKALLIVGPTRSGKGVATRVHTAVLGSQNVVAPSISSLCGEFGCQPLINKLLATITDARLDKANTRGMQLLLAIIGEDAMTINIKNCDPVTLRLPTRFVICSNEVPRFKDASGAIAGRFLTLKMTKSFLGREDPQLTDKLLKELPGILNWALEGYRRLKARGHFVQPERSRDIAREMRELASPIGAFVQDQCVVGADRSVRCAWLFKRWSEWAQSNGTYPGQPNIFGRDLRAVVPALRTVQRKGDAKGEARRCFVGVALKDGSDQDVRPFRIVITPRSKPEAGPAPAAAGKTPLAPADKGSCDVATTAPGTAQAAQSPVPATPQKTVTPTLKIRLKPRKRAN